MQTALNEPFPLMQNDTSCKVKYAVVNDVQPHIILRHPHPKSQWTAVTCPQCWGKVEAPSSASAASKGSLNE